MNLQGKNRGRTETLAEMLALASDALTNGQGIKLTWMMYKANLTHHGVTTLVIGLCERGLLDRKAGRYYTTPKGHEYLVTYSRLLKIAGEPQINVVKPSHWGEND
jgi:predicted transcriptional regulator